MSTRRRKTSAESRIRRKNLNIDQAKLDRVVEILGADSETAAIDQMMDDAILRHELTAGIRSLAGKVEIEDVYPGGWSEGVEE